MLRAPDPTPGRAWHNRGNLVTTFKEPGHPGDEMQGFHKHPARFFAATWDLSLGKPKPWTTAVPLGLGVSTAPPNRLPRGLVLLHDMPELRNRFLAVGQRDVE